MPRRRGNSRARRRTGGHDSDAPLPCGGTHSLRRDASSLRSPCFERPDGNPSPWELTKMALGILTFLAPLRLLLLLLVVFGGGGTVVLVHRAARALGCGDSGGSGGGFAGAGRVAVRLLARAALFVAGFHWIQETGRPRSCRTSTVVVANHVSLLEVLHLVYAGSTTWTDPLPVFVTKASVFSVPVVGYLAREIMQCIGVERKGKPAAAAIRGVGAEPLLRASRRIAARVRAEASTVAPVTVVVFPEGTTSNGRHVLRFRTGAFAPGLPVLPVLYSFPQHGSFAPTFESISAPVWVWRLLSQPWNTMAVRWLPAEAPTADEAAAGPPHALFAERVRRRMADALGVTTYDAGYSEKLEYHARLRSAFKEEPALGAVGWRQACLRRCGERRRERMAMLLTPNPFEVW